MNFSAIKAIFINTIQREMRNKTILSLSALTLLALIGTFQFLSGMMAGFVDDAQNIDQSISLFSPNQSTFRVFLSLLATWTSVMAVMMGANLVRSDQDEMVLHQLLALPIRRSHYLLARIAGASFITLCLYFIAGLVIISYLGAKSGSVFGIPMFLSTLYPVGLMIIGLLLLSSFYSLYLPKIVTLIVSLMSMLFIAHATNAYYGKNFIAIIAGDGLWVKIQGIVYALLPPVASMGRINSAILNEELNFTLMASTSLHAFLAFGFCFFIISWLFKHRDF